MRLKSGGPHPRGGATALEPSQSGRKSGSLHNVVRPAEFGATRYLFPIGVAPNEAGHRKYIRKTADIFSIRFLEILL